MDSFHGQGAMVCVGCASLIGVVVVIWLLLARPKGVFPPKGEDDIVHTASRPGIHGAINELDRWMQEVPLANPYRNPILTFVPEPYEYDDDDDADGRPPPRTGIIYGANGVHGTSEFWFVGGQCATYAGCTDMWGPLATRRDGNCVIRSFGTSIYGLTQLVAVLLLSPQYAQRDGVIRPGYEERTPTGELIRVVTPTDVRKYITFNSVRAELDDDFPLVFSQ